MSDELRFPAARPLGVFGFGSRIRPPGAIAPGLHISLYLPCNPGSYSQPGSHGTTGEPVRSAELVKPHAFAASDAHRGAGADEIALELKKPAETTGGQPVCFTKSASFSRRASSRNGLAMKSSMPAAMQRARSLSYALAVSAMMQGWGMSRPRMKCVV